SAKYALVPLCALLFTYLAVAAADEPAGASKTTVTITLPKLFSSHLEAGAGGPNQPRAMPGNPPTGTASVGAAAPTELVPPMPVPPQPLTFDQIIGATLVADPKIRAGLETIQQANADLWTSSLVPNPTLLADGLLLPLRRFTPDRTGGPPQTDVLVSYPIDWFLFGKRVAAMASASLGVRQAEFDYADLVRQRVLGS